MDIKFGKSIAEKLGLVDPLEKNEAQGDLSARDAALAAKKGGWRVNTQRPTGYARTVRRAQARADAGQDRKLRQRRIRRQRQEADVIDYAGSIARVYFDTKQGDSPLRLTVIERVNRQVEAIAGTDGDGWSAARRKVEDQLRVNLQRMEEVQSERALATQKRKATTKRGRARFTNPDSGWYQAPLGTAMPR